MQTYVNLADLVKSFPTSIYLENRRRCSRGRASQSLEENLIHYSFASLEPAGGCNGCCTYPNPANLATCSRLVRYRKHIPHRYRSSIPSAVRRKPRTPHAFARCDHCRTSYCNRSNRSSPSIGNRSPGTTPRRCCTAPLLGRPPRTRPPAPAGEAVSSP